MPEVQGRDETAQLAWQADPAVQVSEVWLFHREQDGEHQPATNINFKVVETTPNIRRKQKERSVGEHDVSALKLELVELKAQFTSLSEDVKAIRDFIKESQAPKPINYPAWIGALGTMIFLVCAVLMMWVKPLELKLEVQAEKMASLEKSRKEDYAALKDSLMERIAYSFDRLKTEMKLKNQTP